MPLSRIVAPVDFSPQSRKALSAAIELAEKCGTSLDIIHTIEVLTYRGVEYREVMSDGSYDEERKQAASDLEEWADIARQHGIETRCKVIEGDARLAIGEYAQEVGADLVVIGAKGHSRLHDLLVGSVASAVVHRSPCSVYVVR